MNDDTYPNYPDTPIGRALKAADIAGRSLDCARAEYDSAVFYYEATLRDSDD